MTKSKWLQILSKILTSWIQKHIKRIIHHDQVRFFFGTQSWFSIQKSINVICHKNRMKDKTIWYLHRFRRSTGKIQNLFMIKTLKKLGVEINVLLGMYKSTVAQAVESLHSKCEALSSSASITRKNRGKYFYTIKSCMTNPHIISYSRVKTWRLFL
jgi:hypothetical protein